MSAPSSDHDSQRGDSPPAAPAPAPPPAKNPKKADNREEEKDDKEPELRIGRYQTSGNKGKDVQFVYIPAGFNVAQIGGVGKILKAAGVNKVLGADQPRMVLRVPKQTNEQKVERTAAVRALELVDTNEPGPTLTAPWMRTPSKPVVPRRQVLITEDDAKREGWKVPEDAEDNSGPDPGVKDLVALNPAFKVVDERSLDTHRAMLRGKVGRLMRSVVSCCAETRAIMTFDNARRGNSQLDLFSDSSESLVSLGTYEAKDLVAWIAQKENKERGDDKPDPGKEWMHEEAWWHEGELRKHESETLQDITVVVDPTKTKDPPVAKVVVALPKVYFPQKDPDKKTKDRVRDVPHKNVTHALFFSSDAQRRQFDDLLADATIDGLMLVGGPPHAFNESLDALRAGKPIFVFDETGGAASLFAAMKRAHEDRQRFKKLQKFQNEQKKSGKNEIDAADEKLLGEQWLKSEHPWPGPNDQEAVCIAQNWHVYFEDYDKDKPMASRAPWHDWMKWKEKDGIERSKDPVGAVLDAIATEGAWPPAANDDKIYVMKPTTSARKLEDDITRIMYTVEDKSEVGALEAESALIMDAWAQWSVFSSNAKQQGYYARLLYVPLIVLTLATVVLATYESYLNLRSSHRDRRKILRHAITIIPLIAALLIAMYAKWQPMTKWAKLKLAARQVESEIYRFRMRVGEYAPRRRCRNQAFASPDKLDALKDDESLRSPDKSSRVCFSDALAKIWETVQDSEVARGALQATIDRKLDNKVSKVHKSPFKSALINDDGKNTEEDHVNVKPLMPEEYLQQRVYPKLSERLEKAPHRSHLVGLLQFGIFLCTFGAALCGALNAPLLVPVVLAISAAIGSVIEFGLYPQILRANNGTIAELKSIDIWWHGLTFSQRRSMAYRDQLVTRTEYILNLGIAYVSQLTVKQDRRIAAGDNDDDDATKEKKENDPTKTKSPGVPKTPAS